MDGARELASRSKASSLLDIFIILSRSLFPNCDTFVDFLRGKIELAIRTVLQDISRINNCIKNIKIKQRC